MGQDAISELIIYLDVIIRKITELALDYSRLARRKKASRTDIITIRIM